jgi:beta-lactamase superfamily II metal-dependent hydrolase
MAAGYIIDMIDVGQGDAFVIATRTKGGIKNCLIDAGRKSAGSTVVNHLKKHYDGKLTYAVLTHIDDDHIGGFREVLAAGIYPEIVFVNDPRDALERFVKKGAVLLSEQTVQINASITTSDDIIKEIDRLGIERRSAFAGEKLTLSAALKLDFLSPDRDAFPELVSKFSKRNREKLSERAPDARRACTAENDASVVCAATYDIEDLYDRALFTGDACLKTLKRVAKKSFNYVKAPHHGSWHCCDDDLVEAWTAGGGTVRGAFSFGENPHGHPDAEVIESFRSRDAKILCTHCHGTVQSRRAGATSIGKWSGNLDGCTCG